MPWISEQCTCFRYSVYIKMRFENACPPGELSMGAVEVIVDLPALSHRFVAYINAGVTSSDNSPHRNGYIRVEYSIAIGYRLQMLHK